MEEHVGAWVNFFVEHEPESWRAFLTANVLSGWLVAVLLLVLVFIGTRRMQLRPLSRLQVFWEWVVEVTLGFARTAIGPGGERFAPYLGTVFIYVAGLNLASVVPGFLSPTASLSMTAALAIITVAYVQFAGFRAQGLRYLMHFVGEPLWLAPLNIPIHLIGEIARMVSLAVRLYGNIFGEDTVIAQLVILSLGIMKVIHIPLPLAFPMVVFHIFVSFVQALVFTMLTAAYLSGAVTHEGDEHEIEHAPQATEPA
jgi:F-type H+-transporting ATPase subunit a